MGEDYEVEDVCPKCKSNDVVIVTDEFKLVRLSLVCRHCGYLEANNPSPACDCEDDSRAEWESDPESWKS